MKLTAEGKFTLVKEREDQMPPSEARKSHLTFHASMMFSKNLVTFIMEMVDKETKELNLDWENETIDGTCVTFNNEVRHSPTKEALG